MKQMSKFNELATQLQQVISVGDVHGNFGELGFRIKNQYQITDSIICICGDFGMGFYKPNYYQTELNKLNKILQEKNCLLAVARGNHDDPSYFDGNYELSNLKLMKDYTLLPTYLDKILFVGGGLSIDRTRRLLNESYWLDEMPVYNEEALANMDRPTIIISHAAPTFCEPTRKDGLNYWMTQDANLNKDNDIERGTMTRIFDYLEANDKAPKTWCYGHYHFTNKQLVNNTMFKLNDIMEFHEIK